MANKYIKFITFFAVILLIALQIIWLRNSYLFAKNEISTNVSDLLENAIDQETFSRLSLLPKGTMVKSRPKSDSGKDTPEFAYMQESLVELGHPLSLDTVANMYREILRKKHIPNTFSLIMLKDNQLIAQAGDSISSSIFLVKSRKIPIRPDYSITIQAQIINPQKLFYQRMGILLLSTSSLILFVISCIIYQIRIIARMNKIFQIREDFTYAMIHDMKTPLSSIFTALYFLHSGRLDNKPETKEKYYTIAENEVDHLLTLTNRVLTLSKLESHKLEMNREDVPLEPMVENLTVKFTAKAQKPVRFTADLKTPAVYADKEYLEEILSNLIDNAIKYSKPEGVDIRIRSELNEKYTVIKVHDNGLGISEADQRTIFNKYERAAAGRKKNKNRPSGFGLGLNFVQQVMHAHEGKVFVTSIEGSKTIYLIKYCFLKPSHLVPGQLVN